MNSAPAIKFAKNVGFYTAIVIFICVMLFPFYWQLLTSLKPAVELTHVQMWPNFATASLNNYVTIFTQNNFGRYMINSLIVAGLTTVIGITLASSASYALARLKFKGKAIVLGLILSCSMFPHIAVLSPIYIFINDLGLRNTYWGLVIPYLAFALPLSVWYLTIFFKTIPFELEEAAKIDGCTPVQALLKVIIPLAIPGTFTTAILVFIQAWNEYLLSLTINTDDNFRTIPVGITMFRGEFEMPWIENAAAIVVVTIPIACIVLLLQRRIVSGLTSGAVKG